jgi:hypothetical protein
MTRLMEPGIHPDFGEVEYHLDPCGHGPSMAAHDAETILEASRRHCWYHHPRMNPLAAEDLDPEQMEGGKRLKLEHGAALHAMLLGSGRPVIEIAADDYRSKGAKEARLDALLAGQTPILAAHRPRLQAIIRAAWEQIAEHPELKRLVPLPGRNTSEQPKGMAEVVMLWQEPIGTPKRGRRGQHIWCRSRTDWLPENPRAPMIDFLFTAASAAPQEPSPSIASKLFVRAEHYLRGAKRLRGASPRAYWCVAMETEAPHGLCIHTAGPEMQVHARELWGDAAARWHASLSRGTEREHWPWWPSAVNTIEPKRYQLDQWEIMKQDQGISTMRGGGISAKRAQQLMREMGAPVA